jgi:transcriptional antiterminator NusG
MVLSGFDKRWFAVQVKPRCEKSVAAILEGKRYDQFLPLRPARFDGGRKQPDRPLFPGYVFCRFDSQVLGPIVTTPGLIRIVGFGSSPASIPDAEIEGIRTIAKTVLPVTPYPYLPGGQMVRIGAGPLRGLQGVVVGPGKTARLVVSVHLLQRSIAVEISADVLEALDPSLPLQHRAECGAESASL